MNEVDKLNQLNIAIPAVIPKKSRAKRSLKDVNLEKLEKGLKTVLHREISHLLDLSFDKKLDREGSTSLIGYLKAIKDLQKSESDSISSYSDEELEKHAAKSTIEEEEDDVDESDGDTE